MHFPMHLTFRTAPCKNNMPPTQNVHGGVVVMHGNRFCVYAFSKKKRGLKKEKCINCFLVIRLILMGRFGHKFGTKKKVFMRTVPLINE